MVFERSINSIKIRFLPLDVGWFARTLF